MLTTDSLLVPRLRMGWSCYLRLPSVPARGDLRLYTIQLLVTLPRRPNITQFKKSKTIQRGQTDKANTQTTIRNEEKHYSSAMLLQPTQETLNIQRTTGPYRTHRRFPLRANLLSDQGILTGYIFSCVSRSALAASSQGTRG